MTNLFEKYDVAAPRYTSYPTVPYWEAAPTQDEWIQDLHKVIADPKTTWSVYMHLPFCESACSFCACNTIITHNHGLENDYAHMLEQELSLYLQHVPELAKKDLRQFHIGGGTPTFFSAGNLERILGGFYERLNVTEALEGSIEVNPNYTKTEQLKLLRRFGFNRISLGVQDFNYEVQKQVNRVQPREKTEATANEARALGFESVNFDLIFGLPGQTPENMQRTADITIELKPDRIALYSLALVPWVTKAHKRLAQTAARGPEKRKLYEICRKAFLDAGYQEIGMDHFSLPDDSLAKASLNGKLHRNFMGYTEVRTNLLLGFGVSSISQSPGCYHQNEKGVKDYGKAMEEGRFATIRGHVLNDEDRTRYRQILSLMTSFEVAFESSAQEEDARDFLAPLFEDELIRIQDGRLFLTDAGRPFMRNACMAFDQRMRRKMPDTRIFSQSV